MTDQNGENTMDDRHTIEYKPDRTQNGGIVDSPFHYASPSVQCPYCQAIFQPSGSIGRLLTQSVIDSFMANISKATEEALKNNPKGTVKFGK